MPSDIWCIQNGYIVGTDDTGRQIPDYQKALQNNSEMRALISTMGGIMAGRDFPMKSLEAELKKLIQDDAMLDAMAMDQGDMRFIKESNVDKLLKSAKADIIVDIAFEYKSGMRSQVVFNVQALDAYTSKIISGNTGASTASSSASLDILLKESVESYIDQFSYDLQHHFDDLFANGREVKVTMMRWEDSDVDFETLFDYNGQEAELADIIEVWMAEKCVEGRYSVEQRTANMIRFEQVRIPLYSTNIAGREVAIDAAAWLRPLSTELRKEQYGNITTQILTKGLGEVWLIIGEK
ncbi:MAG: DUF6175 family protein [bacterium]